MTSDEFRARKGDDAGEGGEFFMWEMLAHAKDKDGHPITQPTFDKIVGALREIVVQYESKPDGNLGHGLTNGPFLRGREALDLLDGVE